MASSFDRARGGATAREGVSEQIEERIPVPPNGAALGRRSPDFSRIARRRLPSQGHVHPGIGEPTIIAPSREQDSSRWSAFSVTAAALG